MIFSLVLLLASTSALAAPQRGYGAYDIRTHISRVCDSASKWPNSVVTLPQNTEACSGMSTIFIDHKEGQSTITRSTVSSNPNNAMCVRLVGFSLLSRVLESPGGPCDQLQAKLSGVTDWGKFEKIKGDFIELVLQINDNSNVLFVENALGSLKSQIIVNGLKGKNPYKSANLSAPAIKRIEAVSDYLSKTQEFSTPFAQSLDRAIAKGFPGTRAKIEDDWTKAVAFSKDIAREAVKKPTSSSARPSSPSAKPPSSSAKPKVNTSSSAKSSPPSTVTSSGTKPSSSIAAHAPSAKPSSSRAPPSSSAKPSPSAPATSSHAKPPLCSCPPPPSSAKPSSHPAPSSNVKPSSSSTKPATPSAKPSSSSAAPPKPTSNEIID